MNTKEDSRDEINQAALKAMELTNLCLKHMKYHGQKYKSCTPQKRIMVRITEGQV